MTEDNLSEAEQILCLKKQVADLQKKVSRFEDDAENMRYLYEDAPLCHQSLDDCGCLCSVNQTWLDTFGYSREDVIGRNFGDFLTPYYREFFKESFPRLKAMGEAHDVEMQIMKKDLTAIWVSINSKVILDTEGRFQKSNCILETINKRKDEEDWRNIETHLLQICNTALNLNELIAKLVSFFKNATGWEAVGVRLQHHDDFPYFEAQGFAETFVCKEKSLCAANPHGEIIREKNGNPLLECVCGRILSGCFDSDLPYFTSNGSFWTNSTTDLIASITDEDLLEEFRTRCHGQGYQSIALIPLRTQDKTIGLFQFNDTRQGVFSSEKIARLEEFVTYISISVAKQLTDEKLRDSEEKYRLLFENAHEAIIIVQNGLLTMVNPRAAEIIGYNDDALRGKPFTQFIHKDDIEEAVERHKKRLRGEDVSSRYCFRVICQDGTVKWMEQNGSMLTLNGKAATLAFLTDITERKKAETVIAESLEEKEVLLREVHHRVKNNLAAIVGLIDLQRQSIDEPHTQNLLMELNNRIRAMSLVHEKLYMSESLAHIDFEEYIDSLVAQLQTSFGGANIIYDVSVEGIKMNLDHAVPCGMIVNELVTNSLKYAFPVKGSIGEITEKRISVLLTRESKNLILTVADNGIGLAKDFDFATVSSLGLVLVRMIGQHQLGGRFEVDQSQGTRFDLTFSPDNTGEGDD